MVTMQQPANEIFFQAHGGVTVLDIRGDITAYSEAKLNEAYRAVTGKGTMRLLLNIATEAYINSGGIAVLIQILAQTKRHGQVIGITGISEHFKKIFGMVGITKFATIYPSLDEGVTGLSAGAD
jgi:anti-anti-sigma factor